MKRILLIASSCYPVNGAEEIVNIKMLQAFKHSGQFKVDLISRKRKWELYPTAPLEDYDVEVESLLVVEVDNKRSLRTIWQHFKSFLFFGVAFKGSHWAAEVLNQSIKLYNTHNYDYVLTKSESSFLIGYYLKKHYGAKWVATWNDPYPVFKNPAPYGRGWQEEGGFFDRRTVNIMEKYVDVHIFPNNRLRDYMLQYLHVDKSKTLVIPHVVVGAHQSPKIKDNSKLRIIHSGKLAQHRNPNTFFAALSKFVKEKGEDAVSVTILGSVDSKIRGLIEKYELSNIVEIQPPVPYMDSLQLLEDYHIALIIEANVDEGIFLPTKVSDFMQSGKHIFAVSPQKGVLNDLYVKGYIPYFAPVDSVEEICSELFLIYEDFKSGFKNDVLIPPEFSEENIVKQYLNI